ncbi:hypothetical protein [Prauserella marina]|uniref:hypothetical protein n=1 Tax=Prauserella marina TaxID=530584 RepID=UPI0011600092|nr:hypothetical protein [Prauserella marina]
MRDSVTRSKRGTTHAGQPVALPDGAYEPPPLVEESAHGPVVHFQGEDDRTRTFPVDRLPLPGWHRALAAALATTVGPGGHRRTGTSAQLVWDAAGRVMRFMATVPDPPAEPGLLRPRHLKAFHEQSGEARGESNRWRDLRCFKLVIEQPPLRELVPTEAADYLSRRFPEPRRRAKPGYSTGNSPTWSSRPAPTSRTSVTEFGAGSRCWPAIAPTRRRSALRTATAARSWPRPARVTCPKRPTVTRLRGSPGGWRSRGSCS